MNVFQAGRRYLESRAGRFRSEAARFFSAQRFEPLPTEDEEIDMSDVSGDTSSTRPAPQWSDAGDHQPAIAVVNVVGVGWVIGLYITYPFPTTIPLFIGCAICLTGWTFIAWCRIAMTLVHADRRPTIFRDRSWKHWLGLLACTALLSFWAYLGVTPPKETIPDLVENPGAPEEKYFIAANLYENEAVFAHWSDQLIKLAAHLGEENVFISIYESNSQDRTRSLLRGFGGTLSNAQIRHQITSEDDGDRWWPYGTAPERIGYLAKARNAALAPLQSHDQHQRLDDYHSYTKIIFLNDVFFSWQSVIRLLATRIDGDPSQPPDYDLACGMDFGWSGLYDTWVARDVCGTPLRPFWPYVKDEYSVAMLRQGVPFKVAACWNGIVAFPAGPYLYHDNTETFKHLGTRGWKMVDNPSYPGSRTSPPLGSGPTFRSSGIDACDHSECFLFSYDIHRRYNGTRRPPRIYMNPNVLVAYDANWFKWHTVILRVGVVRWWVDHWSRGFPLKLVDWIWESVGRRRDYCTWAGLVLPAHCPALPGPKDRPWDE
ncbi:alpha-1,3-mannosyltransferase, partial [Tremellales sp. Uapishka_1]